MKKHLKLITICFISILIWLLCILFGHAMYETNDDAIINMIAAGAYGEPSQYLVYSGIIWGYLTKFAYMILPEINCYLWLYLTLNLISVIAISFVISEEMEFPGTIISTVLVNVLLAKDLFINIQYTKNSTVYAVAGFLLLLSAIYRRKNVSGRVIISAILILLSSQARKESFIFMLPFALVALVVAFLYSKKREPAAYASILILPVIICVISFAANYVAFNLNPEWKYYYKWDNIMKEKRDYGNYKFDWNQEDYLEAGFTEWDFKMMDEWTWNDPENFTLEKLELMKEIGSDHRMDRLRIAPEVFRDTFDILGESFRTSLLPWAMVVIVFVALIMAITTRDLLSVAATLLMTGGALAENYYLACVRRYYWRVGFGVWISAAFMIIGACILPKITKNTRFIKGKPELIASFIASLLLMFIWQGANLDYSYKAFDTVYEYQHERIGNISAADGLFVLSIDDLYGGLCGARNIYDINGNYAGYYHNIFPVGGWIIPSPIGLYNSRKQGISNVFREFPDREDLYYVGGGEHMGYLLMYLNEKYGPGINVTQVEFDGFEAWKFFRE
ncbi:MAG: hypothetical protein K6G06_02615 [Butyrivibrio sp.]|nr:hypothetical protein [Butyrivibrio sp.]